MADVENCFPDSMGDLEVSNWAVTHKDARKQLKTFLNNYFRLFGDFEDAIDKENNTFSFSFISISTLSY